MCIILNNVKNYTLPIQDIMGVNFYIWVHSFQFGKNLCEKILNLYFRGKFYFIGVNFQFGEILNLCFRDKFRFGKLFLVWANLCMGNLKYLF